MTVELSFIHWDVLDEEYRLILPSEYKLEVVFPGDTAKQPIPWKGYVISRELIREIKTRGVVYPRDFLWKSSKSARMHRWSYNMNMDWRTASLFYSSRHSRS